MSKPIFRIKHEPKASALPSLRIKTSAFNRIEELSKRNGIPLIEVVRQMLDFAIEHIEQETFVYDSFKSLREE